MRQNGMKRAQGGGNRGSGCSGIHRPIRASVATGAMLMAAAGAWAQAEGAEQAEGATVWGHLQNGVEAFFTQLNEILFAVIFFNLDVLGLTGQEIPVIIVVLVAGGVFFTLRYGFINVRLFRHGIEVVMGRYDHPDHEGEISHFKALTSALSATVGLGNIAGVAVAMGMGGPGAVFWMWVTALFGMSLKFSSCTLAQLYRRIQPDGHVLGGPMVYISEGLGEVSPRFARFGRYLAVLFACLTIFAAFGGGNMFQSNQTYELFASQFFPDGAPAGAAWLCGVFLAIPVGIVLLGGISRIGEVTCRLVPAMCLGYIAVCLTILALNADQVPQSFALIFREAFSPDAAISGSFIAVLVTGMRRAAFSNEAGLGSAAIAHAAARTNEPVREGVVAMLGPFIDTILVCTATALAIIVTGAYKNPEVQDKGIEMTALALEQLGALLPYLLFVAVLVFAFSTVITWGYYGERAAEYLFGRGGIRPFRILYVLVVILGPVASLGAVIDFADLMLLSMAFPNILGMVFLSGKVKRLADDYVARLRAGEIVKYDG